MIPLGNNNIGKNVNLMPFLKKFAFIFFAWTCLTYNDVSSFFKSSENLQENDKILKTNFRRLLARYAKQRELQHRGLKEKISDDRWNNKGQGVYENVLTYSNVKNKGSNNLDVYMRNYKHRYMKKKGLSKLDCYYENKIFDKFCHMRDIAQKMQNDRKRWKKIFFKKYGIGLILFALIPALGLIIPVFFGEYSPIVKMWCFSTCDGTSHTDKTIISDEQHKSKDLYKTSISESTWSIITVLNMAIFLSIIFTALIIIFYTLIKVVKYERLKAGKGKIKGKEYYLFCKEVFGITKYP